MNKVTLAPDAGLDLAYRDQDLVSGVSSSFEPLFSGDSLLMFAAVMLASVVPGQVALAQSGIEAHGPTDPIPRCVTKAQKRARACHCDSLNRTPLLDLEAFVMHKGHCILEGGLGPAFVPRPIHVLPPLRRKRA